MLKKFASLIGGAQTLLGVLGVASSDVSSAVGTGQPGNIFNIVSGAVLGFLGLKGGPNAQKVGVPIVSVLNGLVGGLGAAGVQNVLGTQLNQEPISNIINIAIGVVGLIVSFFKKK